MKRIFLSFLLLSIFTNAVNAQNYSPNYEFRGVWVASVDNIDWPGSKFMTSEEQKAAFIKLLDMHAANNMNAVIVQIRPAADALYPSQLEPWSEFLTGRQGLPPSPMYDPLKFMITETHKRGMEFHAWLNPYRAVFNLKKSSVAANHITRTRPDLFLVYGNKREGYKKYFNPGLPEVMQYTANVVKDIVTRYDVDAIHIDDYFYPYRIAGIEFPDQRTYEKYGHGLSKDDWRRSNCDTIIRMLHTVIHTVKPKVKFGVSPFGIWRNKSQDPMGSETKGGQTNYDDLYADILLWLQKGWIDYVVPQLYWERGHRLADYDVLLKWWNEHTYGRQMYIGHGIYRAGTNAAWRNPNEIPAEIRELRKYPTTQGSAYFSSKSFEKNPNGWNDSLRQNYYRYPALIPPMAWIDNGIPAQPLYEKQPKNLVKLVYKGEDKIKAFGILTLPQGVEAKFIYAQLVQVIPADKTAMIDPSFVRDSKGKRIFVVAVDVDNNVSPMTEIK